MMVVLDTSAVIAWLKQESGAEHVETALMSGNAVISSVNLAEVLATFTDLGASASAVARDLEIEGLQTTPFTTTDATMSATLRADPRHRSLSPGDCACLALARRLNAPALTADQTWAHLDVGVTIEVLR